MNNAIEFIAGSSPAALLERSAESSSPSFSVTPATTAVLQKANVEKFRLKSLASHLLYNEAGNEIGFGVEHKFERLKFHRTITCKRVMVKPVVGVHRSIKHGRAFYSGLATCGNPWTCAVCAAKIQSRRQREVEKFFAWAYKKIRKQIMMLTLTFPHGISDDLKETMEKLAYALKLFRSGKSWANFKDEIGYDGLIRSLELTYGKNGWHPHTHELYAVGGEVDEKYVRSYILDRWQNCCVKAGLLDPTDEKKVKAFRRRAVDIKFNAKDTDYLTKSNNVDREMIEKAEQWGADKELVRASTKKGKATGKSPMELLDAAETDEHYRALWLEYVKAFKGKAQLFWSRGLKAKVGVEEKSDEQLAEEQTDQADTLALLPYHFWRIVVKNDNFNRERKMFACAELLNAAENDGFEGVRRWFADYGLNLEKPEFLLPDVANTA